MNRHEKEIAAQLDAMLFELFARAHMQFGDAVISYWLYAEERCPGCGSAISYMKFKGQNALSLNAFIYRQYGVLIGYLLCGRCATRIHRAAQKNPHVQIPLHSVIEQNLAAAYERYLADNTSFH